MDQLLNTGFGRRALLRSSLLTGAALATPRIALAAEPIVETTHGKIRGASVDGINVFKGVPYGASTAGANRFMPPVKPAKWAGIHDALHLGPESPQPYSDVTGAWAPDLFTLWPRETGRDPEPDSEDCLVLNVWTPGLRDGKKRPVMLWIHGGGFTYGSSGPYPGLNLSKFGDVVVVSINHRLNLFGYLYLGEAGGAKYADSGEAGMLDIVASLEWVRDNIANFGGDPGKVTVFGQSGGGFKVSTLMAMPPAKGLFHRAILQSGPGLRGVPRDEAAKSADRILAKLGIKSGQIDDIQRRSQDELLAAMAAAGKDGAGPLRIAPVVDGRSLPRNPFDPDAPAISADVPILIGTNATESTSLVAMSGGGNAPLFALDEAGLKAQVKKSLRVEDSDADKLIAVYRKDYPGVSPSRIYFLMASDRSMRTGSIAEAERKAAQGKAPAYMYLFTWETPVLNKKYGSPHTIELPFMFHDVDNKTNSDTGDGKDRYRLQDQMAGAWVAFARTGDPNVKGLPHWPAYTPDTRATMIFDTECKVVNDPGREERLALASLPGR